MVLSNYKCIQYSNTELQNLIPIITSNVSSNRIKIQEILLILHLEQITSPSYSFQKCIRSSDIYSLHRDFQNCHSTRRSLTRFFSSNSSSNSSSNPTRAHYTTIQRILHPESNSTCRRQRALRVLQSSSRNSTHRRQGDLLEMHPCVFQATPVAPMTFQSFQTFQRHSSLPGNSTIFQYFQGIHPIPAFSD